MRYCGSRWNQNWLLIFIVQSQGSIMDSYFFGTAFFAQDVITNNKSEVGNDSPERTTYDSPGRSVCRRLKLKEELVALRELSLQIRNNENVRREFNKEWHLTHFTSDHDPQYSIYLREQEIKKILGPRF